MAVAVAVDWRGQQIIPSVIFLRFPMGLSCCSRDQYPLMSSESYGHFGKKSYMS